MFQSQKNNHEEVNHNYLYDKVDIQTVLLARLNESFQHTPQNFEKRIYVLDTIDGGFENQLMQRLIQQERGKSPEDCARITLIPCKLSSTFWAGILIEFNAFGIKRAEYVSSIAIASVPEELQSQFNQFTQPQYGCVVKIQPKNLLKHEATIGSDVICIENLVLLAQNLDVYEVIATEEIRKSHLKCLHAYSPEYYQNFFIKQNTTQLSDSSQRVLVDMPFAQPLQIKLNLKIDKKRFNKSDKLLRLHELKQKLEVGLTAYKVTDASQLFEKVSIANALVMEYREERNDIKLSEAIQRYEELKILQTLYVRIEALNKQIKSLHQFIDMLPKLRAGLVKYNLQDASKLTEKIELARKQVKEFNEEENLTELSYTKQRLEELMDLQLLYKQTLALKAIIVQDIEYPYGDDPWGEMGIARNVFNTLHGPLEKKNYDKYIEYLKKSGNLENKKYTGCEVDTKAYLLRNGYIQLAYELGSLLEIDVQKLFLKLQTRSNQEDRMFTAWSLEDSKYPGALIAPWTMSQMKITLNNIDVILEPIEGSFTPAISVLPLSKSNNVKMPETTTMKEKAFTSVSAQASVTDEIKTNNGYTIMLDLAKLDFMNPTGRQINFIITPENTLIYDGFDFEYDPETNEILKIIEYSKPNKQQQSQVSEVIHDAEMPLFNAQQSVGKHLAVDNGGLTRPNRQDEIVREENPLVDYKTLTIGRRLGEGGFGVVYKGKYKFGDVAIKCLLVEDLTTESADEFANEASIMTRLRHPNIIQFFGYCKIPRCLVMEYMPKGSLYDVLHNDKEAIDWTVRIKIAIDITSGLAYLHSDGVNILHRDVKSLNVLLDEHARAKLTDFGLSKVKTETQSKSTAQGTKDAVGTVQWMAPELFKDFESTHTKKADVYSLGMTLWELAARKIPYAKARQAVIPSLVLQGKRETIPSDCPEKFANLINVCWAENPAERPSAAKVYEYLTTDTDVRQPLTFSLTANFVVSATPVSDTVTEKSAYDPNTSKADEVDKSSKFAMTK